MTKIIDSSFTFTDLDSLRNWLNQFDRTDLSVVYFEGKDGVADHLVIDWVVETLSDGSHVTNARISLR